MPQTWICRYIIDFCIDFKLCQLSVSILETFTINIYIFFLWSSLYANNYLNDIYWKNNTPHMGANYARFIHNLWN